MATEKEAEYSPDADKIMAVSLGPQHPGAGHFRIRLWLDGDYVVRAYPVRFFEVPSGI